MRRHGSDSLSTRVQYFKSRAALEQGKRDSIHAAANRGQIQPRPNWMVGPMLSVLLPDHHSSTIVSESHGVQNVLDEVVPNLKNYI